MRSQKLLLRPAALDFPRFQYWDELESGVNFNCFSWSSVVSLLKTLLGRSPLYLGFS
jgi:hypothetical protein